MLHSVEPLFVKMQQKMLEFGWHTQKGCIFLSTKASVRFQTIFENVPVKISKNCFAVSFLIVLKIFQHKLAIKISLLLAFFGCLRNFL
jgi:hypothetical protein